MHTVARRSRRVGSPGKSAMAATVCPTPLFAPACRWRTSAFTDTSHTARPSTRTDRPCVVCVVTAGAGELTQWCAGRRWYSKISPLIAQKRNPTPMTISHHNRNAVATAPSDADSARVNGQ